MSAAQIKHLESIAANAPVLDFNPIWNNGTGYFDGLQNDPTLPVGISTSTTADGRMVLIFNSSDNYPFAFAQRYCDSKEYVGITTLSYTKLGYQAIVDDVLAMSAEQWTVLLSAGSPAIRQHLAEMLKAKGQ